MGSFQSNIHRSFLKKDLFYICCKHLCPSDLQTVNLTLRILFHPDPTLLPSIYTNIGQDYDERILPSIVDEVLKSVVVRLYSSTAGFSYRFFTVHV